MKNFEEIVESSKIRYKSKVFHSKQYNRKGNSNSYTISFECREEVEYGEILYFIQHKNIFYAKVQVFSKMHNEILPDEISGFFYGTFIKFFNKFYSLVDIESSECRYDLIAVDQIKHKCILINYKNNFFHITNVVYDYEHD